MNTHMYCIAKYNNNKALLIPILTCTGKHVLTHRHTCHHTVGGTFILPQINSKLGFRDHKSAISIKNVCSRRDKETDSF